MDRITVLDVFRELRIDPDNETSWAIGQQVREEYKRQYGQLPHKELRIKRSGHGSHCFAVYPRAWRSHIERIVRQHQAMKDKQGDLFRD